MRSRIQTLYNSSPGLRIVSLQMNLATVLAGLGLLAQTALSTVDQLSMETLGDLADELRDVGADYGLDATDDNLLDLLIDDKSQDAADTENKEQDINAPKIEISVGGDEDAGTSIPPLEGLSKGDDGDLYYNNEKVKRIYEMKDEDAEKQVVYENNDKPPETSYEKIKSVSPIKSIQSIKSIGEVKSIKPIKSIQEIKSMKTVKSIQQVPDEIARKFIAKHGLISSNNPSPNDMNLEPYDDTSVDAEVEDNIAESEQKIEKNVC